jgi:hypothetical protein
MSLAGIPAANTGSQNLNLGGGECRFEDSGSNDREGA